ncbi:MAG: hypothetical protein J3Q66DRAFT_331244 [Benniella sp.]|nr:MAG: hypothetical protein J3Q66DRAFT_331244 [Benniella sp.]
MSSCPLLEKLMAPHVDALVVIEGGPWVCSRLKFLDLTFCFDPPSTVSCLQPLIFDRLSKLTRLEHLCMVGPERQHNIGGTVDMKIGYGLDKLSTLQLLDSVRFRKMTWSMGDMEVDWMLEHWKSLTLFMGSPKMFDDTVREALVKRIKRHGILVDLTDL